MTTKTNGRYDTEFKKMIVQKHEAGESVLNLCKDFNLKEGTVYPRIKQYSKSGTSGNASKKEQQLPFNIPMVNYLKASNPDTVPQSMHYDTNTLYC